jgi:pimeloyl-ACP methyl ester carboxylesterase
MGAVLGNVATVDTARDMDQIRQALGEQRITYIGYSYGTYLGAVYANMFPTHVRAMVLDGVSDPDQPAAQFFLTQARGFDRGIDQFFASCAQRRSCPFYSGGHPAAAFASLARRIQAHPLRVGKRYLGTQQFLGGVTTPLYSDDEATLAKALAAAANGNGAPLLKLNDQGAGRRANGTYSTQGSSTLAIDCLDGRGIDGVRQALALQHRFVTAAPVFGRQILYGAAVCGYWPESPRPPRLPVSAAGAPPILVIGSSGDPITPLSEAVTLAHSLRSGVLLTATTKGHTTMFGNDGSVCNTLGIPYLLTGKPPANGSRCVDHSSNK